MTYRRLAKRLNNTNGTASALLLAICLAYAFGCGQDENGASRTRPSCLAGAMALHEALGWEPDVTSGRWKVAILLPQIGLIGAWATNPVWLVIGIAAFLSLSANVVGWSMYLLFNHPAVLGEDRTRSYVWNLGIVLYITLINATAIVYVMNQFGWWF